MKNDHLNWQTSCVKFGAQVEQDHHWLPFIFFHTKVLWSPSEGAWLRHSIATRSLFQSNWKSRVGRALFYPRFYLLSVMIPSDWLYQNEFVQIIVKRTTKVVVALHSWRNVSDAKQKAIFTSNILTCHSGKITNVLMITLVMAKFYLCVPVSHDSVTVSQHVQYQGPETEAAKWNSAIVNLFFLLWFFEKGHCTKHRFYVITFALSWYIFLLKEIL